MEDMKGMLLEMFQGIAERCGRDPKDEKIAPFLLRLAEVTAERTKSILNSDKSDEEFEHFLPSVQSQRYAYEVFNGNVSQDAFAFSVEQLGDAVDRYCAENAELMDEIWKIFVENLRKDDEIDKMREKTVKRILGSHIDQVDEMSLPDDIKTKFIERLAEISIVYPSFLENEEEDIEKRKEQEFRSVLSPNVFAAFLVATGKTDDFMLKDIWDAAEDYLEFCRENEDLLKSYANLNRKRDME